MRRLILIATLLMLALPVRAQKYACVNILKSQIIQKKQSILYCILAIFLTRIREE